MTAAGSPPETITVKLQATIDDSDMVTGAGEYDIDTDPPCSTKVAITGTKRALVSTDLAFDKTIAQDLFRNSCTLEQEAMRPGSHLVVVLFNRDGYPTGYKVDGVRRPFDIDDNCHRPMFVFPVLNTTGKAQHVSWTSNDWVLERTLADKKEIRIPIERVGRYRVNVMAGPKSVDVRWEGAVCNESGKHVRNFSTACNVGKAGAWLIVKNPFDALLGIKGKSTQVRVAIEQLAKKRGH